MGKLVEKVGQETPKKSGWGGARPNTGGKRPGSGRKKGTPNKINADLKNMIITALDKAGGVKYLQRQADENPAAFMTLVGKVLPMTVQGTGDRGELVVTWANPDGKD